MKSLMLVIVLLFSVSCAQVRSVSQTSIPTKRGTLVKAEVKNNIFFFFNFNTTYLNELSAQLSSKCEKGSVEGILTKDVVVTYFPIIFYQEQISAEGFCVN
ncbi:MAG: hypothetical protein LW878_03705 [Proteobacteria bacterium]|jgi:hypothetical protein|nr:hypothetical protein [Pseudomonadota bacterium]